ncbi:MAG: SpvB/TcaC N-terminal domain-containing protein [Candidatus Omnitrophota bacterium]
MRNIIPLLIIFFLPATLAFASAPTLGMVSPANTIISVQSPVIFTAHYNDADGWKDIRYAYIHINSSTNKSKSFYAYYERSTNKLYLRDDGNTSWIGGIILGTDRILENSYVKLDCLRTKITGSGTKLIVAWSIEFKQAFLGAKYIYLYMKDASGLKAGWTKKGTCTMVETGTIIGPAGGEVISSDGKTKLIIPVGALASFRGIEIIAVDSQAMKDAIPSQKLLLNVVECKPYGLVFARPVQLIYQLNQASIPGTPVELGLYDSVAGCIKSTGILSEISADGLSAMFFIEHFSTYAALINLVSQGESIGGGVKVPLPDLLTGAFSHGIPLTISPGRKGMQPALTITYRSLNPNSWLGMGFDLKMGFIVRSTRLGIPSYDDLKDTFYFMTDSGATELVHLVDNLYQAKVESAFTRFYKESDDSWRAVTKDGSSLIFGQTPDSKENGFSGTFSWHLTKFRDTNSNSIVYEHIKDGGKVYLKRITYTGNEEAGVVGKNSIDFILEDRRDEFSSLISGSRISVKKRLKEIQTKCDGQLVWKYSLEYRESKDTNRSLLASFKQCASDGNCFPAQKFDYQKN